MDQQEAQTGSIHRWTKEAIDSAMCGEWERAAAINRSILEFYPADVDAYNRLGRALMELGEYAQAREAYTHALEIDPDNSIAKKNLSRLAYVKEPPLIPKGDHRRITNTFIEENPKSGVVSLRQLASKETLARIATGEEVYLRVKGEQLVVENGGGEYLGRVERRYELHLIKLIDGGNSYAAAIASVKEDEVKVIIREIYQHPNQAGILSFAPEGIGYAQLVYAEEQQSDSPFEGEGFNEEKDSPLQVNFGEVSEAEETDESPENFGFSSDSNLSE